MSTINHILVAVGSPGSLSQPAILKAAQLARKTGAALEVFHALFDPAVEGLIARNRQQAQDEIETLVEITRKRLEKTISRMGCADVPVRVSVRWDYPAHDAIVRQAARRNASMVFAESRRHKRSARLFLSNTDWQLIQVCPVPLILVKSHRPWTTAKVLAAVDPLHSQAKPAALDPRILKIATQLASPLGSQLHVAHVFAPLLGYAPGIMTEPLPYRVSGREARNYAKHVRRSVLKETRRYKVSERAVHLIEGEPSRELIRLVTRFRAQLVVMGAVSRTGLKRLFIGNTAEKVIDAFECDVCVVKPPGFRTPVPARPAHLPISSRY